MIREFKSYWWGSGDNPIKKDDHCLDELRYYLMNLTNSAPNFKEEKNEIQRDKEKLARQIRRKNYFI